MWLTTFPYISYQMQCVNANLARGYLSIVLNCLNRAEKMILRAKCCSNRPSDWTPSGSAGVLLVMLLSFQLTRLWCLQVKGLAAVPRSPCGAWDAGDGGDLNRDTLQCDLVRL